MSTKASDREKRRAAALRQNLKRRKETVRQMPAPVQKTEPGMPADRPNTAKKPH